MTKKKPQSKIQFAVITEIPTDYGNYACSELLINPYVDKHVVGANIVVEPPEFDEHLFADAIRFRDSGATTIDLTKKQMLMCNTPVFRLGEILVIGDCDRTIPDGRKPSKWNVGCEYFDNIEDAVKRARGVVE